jgi:hypothetical protein
MFMEVQRAYRRPLWPLLSRSTSPHPQLSLDPIHVQPVRGKQDFYGGGEVEGPPNCPPSEGISIYSVVVTSPRGNFRLNDRPRWVTDLKTYPTKVHVGDRPDPMSHSEYLESP